jgi:hypothetical protein
VAEWNSEKILLGKIDRNMAELYVTTFDDAAGRLPACEKS